MTDAVEILRSMNKENPNVYAILAAIRGPDNENEGGLKEITRAIRNYIGYRQHTCAGDTYFSDITHVDDFRAMVDKLLEKYESYTMAPCTHYECHLAYAIKAIGSENLIQHAGEMIKDMREALDDADEEFEDDSD